MKSLEIQDDAFRNQIVLSFDKDFWENFKMIIDIRFKWNPFYVDDFYNTLLLEGIKEHCKYLKTIAFNFSIYEPKIKNQSNLLKFLDEF